MANTPRRPRSCEICAQQYVPTYYEQRTCGRYCGGILRGVATSCVVAWRECPDCGSEYTKPGRHCARPRAIRPVLPDPQRKVECNECGIAFVPGNSRAWVYCSDRCQRRARRMRRKVREAETFGHWRWSDFMRIAHKFDYCCAYCGDRPVGQLDPDHVIPLAKQGPNTASNLLPACQSCNGQKTDMLLHEWAAYRKRRGLPPLRTTWDESDPRYFHLTAVRSVAA